MENILDILNMLQIFLSSQVFWPPRASPRRQDEREFTSVAAGKIKSRGQEELWFCHNCTLNKAKTRGCFGVPLELLKEKNRLFPMLTPNRK